MQSTYEIRIGRSRDPLGPYLDRDGVDMTDGGGSLILSSAGWMRGPGHASVSGAGREARLRFHYYDARRDGLPWVGALALEWTDGWPAVDPAAVEAFLLTRPGP